MPLPGVPYQAVAPQVGHKPFSVLYTSQPWTQAPRGSKKTLNNVIISASLDNPCSKFSSSWSPLFHFIVGAELYLFHNQKCIKEFFSIKSVFQGLPLTPALEARLWP